MTLVKLILDVKDSTWIAANPTKVLSLNEPVYRNDGLVAYGDGVTPLSGLTFYPLFSSGSVQSVTGTSNRISVNNTDPENPIVNIDSAYDTAITNAISAAVSGKEDKSNKQTDLTPSATKYPTVDAVNAGLEALKTSQKLITSISIPSSLTGVTAQTIFSPNTAIIQPSKIVGGAVLRIVALVDRVTVSSTTILRINITPTYAVGSGFTVLTTTSLSSAFRCGMLRFEAAISLDKSLTRYNPVQSSSSDSFGSGQVNAVAIDWNVPQYVTLTTQPSSTSETIQCIKLNIYLDYL